MKILFCTLLFFVFTIIACHDKSTADKNILITGQSLHVALSTIPISKVKSRFVSEIELIFIGSGLVNISTLDSTIKVRLMYGTTNNFTKVNLYANFNQCFLPAITAQKLIVAQKYLKENFPNYSLLVLDATRPHHIQQIMWDTLDLPFNKKIKYLAHPDSFSLHNFGAAIDLTVVDENNSNNELDMGTPFDFFGELAQPCLEKKMLALNKISLKQIINRSILRNAMTKAGFSSASTEWWHFNAMSKNCAVKTMKLIE